MSGGKVFYIFSVKTADKKVISNPEVIEEIRARQIVRTWLFFQPRQQ
nr:hypothetical protein [Candidatus Sigynarchaeum springense]